MGKRADLAEIQLAVKLWLKNWGIERIARKMHRDSKSVRRWLIVAGVKAPSNGKASQRGLCAHGDEPTPEEEAEVAERIAEIRRLKDGGYLVDTARAPFPKQPYCPPVFHDPIPDETATWFDDECTDSPDYSDEADGVDWKPTPWSSQDMGQFFRPS